MECSNEKILNVKYNDKKNLLEIGQVKNRNFIKKNKFILCIMILIVTSTILYLVLLNRFISVLKIL